MAEIKISDLSVGDWVTTDYEDSNGDTVCKVEGIEKWRNGYVLIVKRKDGNVDTLGIRCFKPIPITAEILEKNGFEELKDKSWVGHNHHCHIQQHRSSWTLLANKRGFYRTIRFEGLEFVHQLQNALRLAGVGKEIEV